MLDGFYKVEFQTPLGGGSGVVVLQGGRVWGGDSTMYYTGSYAVNGTEVSAELDTSRHTYAPEVHPVFGQDRVHISRRGTVGDFIELTGQAREAPGIEFRATMSRLDD